MGAYVEHDFERGFIIGEEQLRKIHDIIVNRFDKIKPLLYPDYRISRGDSYSYTTKDIKDVLSEDNDDWRAITQLDIMTSEDDIFEFRLTFYRGGVTIYITGEDRDSVFLIFSDLREYIKNDVLVRRPLNSLMGRGIGLAMFSLFMASSTIYLISNTFPHDSAALQKAIESSDLSYKFNYLLNERKASNFGMTFSLWMALMVIGMATFSTNVISNIWNAIFPANIFLFGKRKISFERRSKLWGNVVWVVLIGALVSILAGLFVWWLTGKHG